MKTLAETLAECAIMAEEVRARHDANRRGRRQGVARKGSDHGMAKLTEGQVQNIRLWRSEGATLVMIAKRYGVHKSTVQYALKRGWKHVP